MSKTVDRKIKSVLLFSAVAFTTGLLSHALDVLLARSRMPGVFVAVWPHLVVGAAAGVLSVQLVILLHERREVVQDRLCKLADMNHHIRNALTIVAFYGTQGSPAGAQLVSDAVKRIEWALREVLPKGWNASIAVRGHQQTGSLPEDKAESARLFHNLMHRYFVSRMSFALTAMKRLFSLNGVDG